MSQIPKIFNINKPVGPTSTSVVGKFKRTIGREHRRVGHFGTLDPFACGVLLVGIDGAARLNNYVHKYLSKTYLAIGKFGEGTDSGDLTMPVSCRSEITPPAIEHIEKLIQESFTGEYWQAPPVYSACKHEGRRLCDLARQGVIIRKDAKQRFIHSLQIIHYKYPYLSLRAEVSSGTYVRQLFVELAEKLGTCGHLRALQRERVGTISVQDGLSVRDINEENLQKILNKTIPLDELLPFTRIYLKGQDALLMRNGGLIDFPEEVSRGEDPYWIYDESKKLIGTASIIGEQLKVLFNLPQS